MTKDELKEIVEKISVRFNYSISHGEYPDDLLWIEVSCVRPDRDTGRPGIGRGGKRFFFAKDATVNSVLRTCLAALIAYEEHEVRENFLYDGKRIFDPHMEHV